MLVFSGRRREDNIATHLKEIGWDMFTDFISLWVGTSGGLLQAR